MSGVSEKEKSKNKKNKDPKDKDEKYEDDFEADSEEESNVPTANVSKKANTQNGTAPESSSLEERKSDSVLLKKMENRRANGGGQIQQKVQEETKKSPRISSATRKIDFVNAQERRGFGNQPSWLTNFHSIVKFENVIQQVAEVVPMVSYEYYIQLFGKGNQNQSSTQTNDDSVVGETQTEVGEKDSVWTQYPPNDTLGLGWGRELESSSNLDSENGKNEEMEFLSKLHDSRYIQFVDIAGKLLTDILSSRIVTDSHMFFTNKSKLAFSAGYEFFSLEHLKAESRVSAVTVRSNKGCDSVLTAFYVKTSDISYIRNRTVILEFHMEPESLPSFAFLAENEVCALCYGPDDSPIVCAGLIDGSCVAYDMNESTKLHGKYKLSWPGVKNGLFLRFPSYDTAFTACENRKSLDKSPIVWIVAVGEVANFSFQLVTMNQRGTIVLYTLTESSTVLSEQFISNEFGMRPSSRIKLTRTNTIPNTVPAMRFNTLIANCMVVNPKNIYQVLIATNDGSIINYTRVKQDFSGPRVYSDDSSPNSEVCSIRFSPFDSRIFAAGLSSGNISIYRLNRSDPVLTLAPPNSSRLSVTNVEWSPTTSHILYSIHAGERILIWDIATGKSPLHICEVQQEFGAKIISTVVWRNENNIGMMGCGLSNDVLIVHALEKLVSQREEDLLEMTEKFQKSF
ncbi:hypothetical protein FO519_008479 [Halicephalobus sp. NKZ332]|nr:hypothetical protein FO519_008479 [Halicephalobus sp. NKZ332]